MSTATPDSDEVWKMALDGQLSAWRLKLRSLGSEIVRLQLEHAELEGKLKAAEVLLGRPHIPEMHEDDRPLSVREAVHSLMKDGKPRDGGEIRAALIAAGYDASKVSTHTGAFYTALARLVDKGVLTKNERGVYRLKELDPLE